MGGVIIMGVYIRAAFSQAQGLLFEEERPGIEASQVPETQEDRFIVPRFHLLGVITVGWFAFAFDTASTSLTAAEN